MTFDIASLKPLDTIEHEVVNPLDGKPVGITLILASYRSERVKAAERELINKRLREERRVASAEEIEANGWALTVASVVGWRFAEGVTFHGTVPEFSPENVERLLKEVSFIADQVDKKASDLRTFLPR